MTAEIAASRAGSPQRLPPPPSPLRREQNFHFYPKTPARGQHNLMSGACFNCKQQGHWARDCPQKLQNSPGPSPPPHKSLSPKCLQQQQQQYPELLCECGRPCVVKTSHTPRNPNRDFYTCASPRDEQCTTFVWCDSPIKVRPNGANSPAKPDEQRGDQPQRPECLCKAGPCRIEIVRDEGEMKGCKYYACHLKKGQGACAHFEWCCTDIPEINENRATEEVHLSYYQMTEEAKSNGMLNHGAIRVDYDNTFMEKDLPSFLPTPPKSEHKAKHLGSGSPSPPVKRLNFSEASPSKRSRAEECLNDCVESLTFGCYLPDKERNPQTQKAAVDDSAETEDIIIPETPLDLQNNKDYTENLTFNSYPEPQKGDCDTDTAQLNCSEVKRSSLAEARQTKLVKCVFCGEEGHEISECIAIAM